MTQHYKILNLHVENVKRVQMVDITPTGDTVIIAGKNAQGKSSVLDSIEMLFKGADAIPGQPIRKGEEKGHIIATLGDLVVKRTFTEKGSYIFVETAEGARYQKPQEMLDKFVGSLSFDPLEFTRMKPKDQYDTLKGMVKVDIETIEDAIKTAEEERTFQGRELKNLQGQFAGLTPPEGDPQPVDTAEKVKELNAARAIRQQGTTMLQAIATANAEVIEMTKALEEAEINLAGAKSRQEHHNEAWEAFKPTVPTKEQVEAIEHEIATAGEANQKVSAAKQYHEKKEALALKEKEVATLTGKIDKARADKAATIAAAQMPVKGLSLEEGQVLFNGIPLNQASGAEQIRISTAIAMAGNPALRVIRIKDASIIDDEGMEAITNMAKEHDFQVWFERIESNDPTAVIIEDGMVQGQTIMKDEEFSRGTGEAPAKRKKS